MRTDREEMPLNCVSWTAARAFCQYFGGDLPTEAQWEYAAQTANGPADTLYPYGDADPSCEHVVFGRLAIGNLAFVGGNRLHRPGATGSGRGSRAAFPGDDVTPGIGLVGMSGSMSEFMVDAYAPFVSACWARASIVDPACIDDASVIRSLRGGSWGQSSIFLNPSLRLADNIFENGLPASQTFQGFRCVYHEGAP